MRRLLLALLAAGLAGVTCVGVGPGEPAPVKHWPKDYRHIHKKQAQLATQGKPEGIPPLCEKMLADYPGDGESLFFLALAQAQLGQHDRAKAAIDRALQAGLPPGRFLAGPRAWLRAIREEEPYAAFRDDHGRGLVHGPMLGCLTDRGARFWVRTAFPARVQVLLGTTPEPEGALRTPEVKTSAETDFTAVLEATGLKPSTRYHYAVLVDGRKQPGAPLAFTTAPPAGKPTRLRFAFGGGAAYTPRFSHMWDTIAGRQPERLLLLGDNVYIDSPNDPNYQHYLYHRRHSEPGFRRLVGRTAVNAIWDDHDFGTNDCAGGPAIDIPAWKVPVWNVFRTSWVNPAYGGGEGQPGCWHSFSHGDVDFFLLDGRYYRTPGKAAGPGQPPTMLGPVQKRWLLAGLEASKATFKVIASPVPWIGGNPDKWTGFPEEREEIFSFLEKKRIEGAVLLSADRHRSDLLRTRRPKGYDLHEFMSSRLTNVHTHGQATAKDGALFSYNKKCSFGLVTVDTTKPDPEVTYEIISIDNEPIHTFTLKRSQLRLPPPGE